MIKLTINNNNYFVNKIQYYSNGLSSLSTFTIFGLQDMETLFLNQTVPIWINDSVFLKSFTIVSIHHDEVNNNIILFGKDKDYDC